VRNELDASYCIVISSLIASMITLALNAEVEFSSLFFHISTVKLKFNQLFRKWGQLYCEFALTYMYDFNL
jgi:hypothetical protein